LKIDQYWTVIQAPQDSCGRLFQEPYTDQGQTQKSQEANLKNRNLATMSTETLWSLREKIDVILATKLDAEKQELERRLARLNGRIEHKQTARRPYPKVHPKYCNPERPSETWSGRGKQPRWVGAQLRSGTKIDDLLIARTH
jgi:DNA-binding protein H-NS